MINRWMRTLLWRKKDTVLLRRCACRYIHESIDLILYIADTVHSIGDLWTSLGTVCR